MHFLTFSSNYQFLNTILPLKFYKKIFKSPIVVSNQSELYYLLPNLLFQKERMIKNNVLKDITNIHQTQPSESNRLLDIVIATQKELKKIRDDIVQQQSENRDSQIPQSEQQQNLICTQLSEMKQKYHQMIICRQDQRKKYQICIAEKDEEIETLKKLLRSSYLKQTVFQAYFKNMHKQKICSQINAYVSGQDSHDQIDNFGNSKTNNKSHCLKQDLQYEVSFPQRILSQKNSVINSSRIDRIKQSLGDLSVLKRHFGNDSKFRQNVLDV